MAIITLARAKLFLQITDTTRDALIEALIPEVEADYERLRNRDFDVDSNDDIEYPDGSELVAAQMIGFHLQPSMKSGGAMKSESIGSYSYTRDDNSADGYPKSITCRIKRYVRAK
jgi:hypothetical protein